MTQSCITLWTFARQNISFSAVVKCKRTLNTTNDAPRHSLRSFVNHFQQQNLQTLHFIDENVNHIYTKRRKLGQAWQVSTALLHMANLAALFSASAIKVDMAFCQNSSCTQGFTWIHNVHAVNLHKPQYRTEKRPHTSKQLNIHVQNHAQTRSD